jgi:E3 ubiquitin-protein ligase DMA1/2
MTCSVRLCLTSYTGLFAVTINQALFIAPCSHAFHYKCLRPLLESNHPAFSCPLCRTFADLEEDVEVEVDPELDLAEQGDLSEMEGPKPVGLGEKMDVGGVAGDFGGASVHGPIAAAAIIRERRDREAVEDALVAGAETEVEVDLLGSSRLSRTGPSRWQGRTPVMPGAMFVDLTEAEDEDEQMMDARSRESHSLSPVAGINEEMEAFDRDQSLSPTHGHGGPSSSRPIEDGVTSDSDGGSAGGESLGEESHFHGKRKR